MACQEVFYVFSGPRVTKSGDRIQTYRPNEGVTHSHTRPPPSGPRLWLWVTQTHKQGKTLTFLSSCYLQNVYLNKDARLQTIIIDYILFNNYSANNIDCSQSYSSWTYFPCFTHRHLAFITTKYPMIKFPLHLIL
jgi:hypothetical protein